MQSAVFDCYLDGGPAPARHAVVNLSVTVLILSLLAWSPALADPSAWSSGLPVPRDLKPCSPSDPVASEEVRVATALGGQFLSCFHSEKTTTSNATESTPPPAEYAFSIAPPGGNYTSADLDKLLLTVKEQWKDFDPLGKEFKEKYIGRLNDLIKGNGVQLQSNLVSMKPVLISIDRMDSDYYVVTPIRTYVQKLKGERLATTMVNSGAVVLRDSHLVRLTIERTLTDPADVGQVQSEIVDWARSTARRSVPNRQ